jgi:hypothetical protein
MVPRRAKVAPLTCVISLSALPLIGCSLLQHEAAKDAGVDAGVVALVVLDAGPPVAVTPVPENVNKVGRFPDEVSMNDAAAKIADQNVSARNAVPGGVLVATLKQGTPVTQVAKHENFILCIFPDPKNAPGADRAAHGADAPSHNLEGWIAEQAFIPGPTIPSKAACGKGQTRLMVDEQDFCGRTCKADSDCPSGQACAGKANLYANGKLGAEATTCTIPAPTGAPGASAPATSASAPLPTLPGAIGKLIPGVQAPPLPGNQCLPTYVLGPDKLCHKDCSMAACPAGAKCAHALGQALCEPQ